MMKMVADKAIPYLHRLFGDGPYELLCTEADAIQPALLKDASILITRSLTRLDAQLLAGSSIQVVASPTSGFDHMDLAFLNQAGIDYLYAPGCNAQAVAEYVLACLAYLSVSGKLPQDRLWRMGLIGLGHVGQRVLDLLQPLASEIRCYDPPRALRDPDFKSDADLKDWSDLDIISVHAALTREPTFSPSFHVLNKAFFQRQRSGTVLINASRGAVINTADWLNEGRNLISCLDVFESEPDLDPRWVRQALIATPHIAGHTVESKWRGVHRLYQALCDRYGLEKKHGLASGLPSLRQSSPPQSWVQAMQKLYQPQRDYNDLRQAPSPNALKKVVIRKRQGKGQRYEFETVFGCDILGYLIRDKGGVVDKQHESNETSP